MKRQAIYPTESVRGWLPWGALAPFLAVVLVVVPSIPATLLLRRLRLVGADENPIGVGGMYSFLLLTFTLIGLVVLAWVALVERRSFASIGLVRRNAAKTFLRGFGVGLAMSSAIAAAIWLTGSARAEGFGRAFATPVTLLHMGLLLACFSFQSSVEEVVFRGWLFSGVALKLNVPIAIVVTSLAFTLLHFEPKVGALFFVNICLFSVFACSWALRVGDVWGVMGWHGAWNWLFGVGYEVPITGLNLKMPALIVRLVPTGSDLLTGGAQGPEGSLFCTALLVAGTVFVWWRTTTRPQDSTREARVEALDR